MFKIRTHHKNPDGRTFAWMTLILGLGIGLILPIFPNFVKQIVHTDENVSLFYAFMSIMMLFGALASTIIFKKVDRVKITKWSFFLFGLAYLFLIFANRVLEISVIRTIQIWVQLFLLMTLALFVREFSKHNDLGKEEGIYYLFHNVGILIGPLIGGFLAASFGYEIIFVMAATTSLVGLAYFYHLHVIEENPTLLGAKKLSQHELRTNIKDFFASPARIKSYVMTIMLMLWFGFRILYIPLYVMETGYLESVSGLILSLGIIPLILLEVKVGEYADKKGVHIPVTLGFAIIAALLFLIFLIPIPLVNFIILIIINIGAALVEPLQEFFLFKNLPKEDENRLYGIYMTADPIAFFLGPAMGALILHFFSFKYLFLFLGFTMLATAWFSWKRLKHQ